MPDSLQIALKNDSDSNNLHAYITGIAIQNGGQRCLLKANGHDLYFPQNPSSIGSELAEDCAVFLGQPGSTTIVTIPQVHISLASIIRQGGTDPVLPNR